jgi:hypothetical protein
LLYTRIPLQFGNLGWGGFFRADKFADITDNTLTTIEKESKSILSRQNLSLLFKEASRQLPDKIVEAFRNENHNDGCQYLQGNLSKDGLIPADAIVLCHPYFLTHRSPPEQNPFQQEYFEPKSPFKSNDLKGLVNFSRAGWTIVELLDRRFTGI